MGLSVANRPKRPALVGAATYTFIGLCAIAGGATALHLARHPFNLHTTERRATELAFVAALAAVRAGVLTHYTLNDLRTNLRPAKRQP
jgi:glycine/D-amino acid oxidase-like deaminating enzyme